MYSNISTGGLFTLAHRISLWSSTRYVLQSIIKFFFSYSSFDSYSFVSLGLHLWLAAVPQNAPIFTTPEIWGSVLVSVTIKIWPVSTEWPVYILCVARWALDDWPQRNPSDENVLPTPQKKRNWLNEVARATARNFLLLTLNIQIERRVHKLTLNVFIGIFFLGVEWEKTAGVAVLEGKGRKKLRHSLG